MSTFEEHENTLRCLFSGKLDTEICIPLESELAERINAFVADHDQTRLIFDLAAVDYISSAFLRLCLMYCKLVGTKNFLIDHASPGVLQVFKMAGFAEMMQVR